MNRMLNMDAVNVPILITYSTHPERRAWGRFWKTSMLIIDRKEWKQYLMTCCVQNEATAESLLRYSIDRYRLKSAHLKRKLQPLNLLLPFVKFCSGLTIPHSNEISGSHVKQEPLSNHSFFCKQWLKLAMTFPELDTLEMDSCTRFLSLSWIATAKNKQNKQMGKY